MLVKWDQNIQMASDDHEDDMFVNTSERGLYVVMRWIYLRFGQHSNSPKFIRIIWIIGQINIFPCGVNLVKINKDHRSLYAIHTIDPPNCHYNLINRRLGSNSILIYHHFT